MIRFLRLLFPKPEVDFALLAFLQLFSLWNDIGWLAMASKALLMPCLLFWVWPFTANKGWLRLAMLASWLGDIWLLWGDKPAFFMLGLGSFLVAQLAYAYAFLQADNKNPGLLRQKPWLSLPVWTVAVFIFIYLHPYLGAMMLPVAIYVVAISLMVLSAINRAGFVSKGSLVLVLAVISFLLSDALLAIDKFVQPIPRASLWIMLSYMLAQFGIARSYWLAEGKQG